MDTSPRMTPMLKLTDKDFKAAIVTELKDIKENMLVVNEQTETINKNQVARPQPEPMVKVVGLLARVRWKALEQRESRPSNKFSL